MTVPNMISHEILEQLKVPALKELCRQYKLNVSGNKSKLLERIIAHQVTVEEQQTEQKNRLAYGSDTPLLPDGTPDHEFEATMSKFVAWCEANHFDVHKIARKGVSFEKVDHREIRASFKDYDPAKSTLRADRFVPVPQTKTEVFLEMFFDKLGGEWEMFGSADATEEEEFEKHEHRFAEEMKRTI